MAARQRVRINSPVGSSKQRSGAVAFAPEHHSEVAEAAAAAVFGQRASTPSTADVLTAQRFAGNQVMTRLLHARDLIAPGPPMASVQRNEESQKLLAKLAKPQVLPGPEVQVQDDIVTGLEAKISEAVTGGKEKESHYIVSCLGGILLGTTPGDLDTLIKQSKLYDLPEGERSIGPSTFDLAVEAGVTEKIVINTLATMEAAGQLDYLRKSGLIDTDWKVIVEVHYYRDRNPEQTKFHKDSTGQTLFVNLNFTNEQEIAGPEVVVNPATSPDYEKKLEKGSYQNAKTLKRFKLPKVFVEDLQQTKQELGEPEEIIQTVVKPKHFVAFVDEAVHHKTPTLGHRTVTTLEIDSYMRKKYKHDYGDASQAYKAFTNRGYAAQALGYKYPSYFKEKDNEQYADFWWAFFTHKAQHPDDKYNRTQLPTLFDWPKDINQKQLIEDLIEEGGDHDFGRAELRHAGILDTPVKKEGRPPLVRQRSQMELKGTSPKPLAGKRRFFRTWVRAVPRNPT